MNLRGSNEAREARIGRRKPTSAREWLRRYLLGALLGLVVVTAVNAVWRALLPRETWPSAEVTLLQMLVMPVITIGAQVFTERKLLRLRPRLLPGNATEIQIRNKTNGDVLATVGGDSLRYAALADANLEAACLWGEELSRADFSGANLSRAYLRDANLEGADLSRAQLRGTHLMGASLCNANLRGADLRETYLDDTELTGAIYDQHTRWDPSFKPKLRGCKLLGDSGEGLPIPAEASPADLGTLPLPAGGSQAMQSAVAADVSNPVEIPPVRTC